VARRIAYQTLLRTLRATAIPPDALFRSSVHSVIRGFVPAEAYWHACAEKASAPRLAQQMRANAQLALFTDLNPVAELLRNSKSLVHFSGTWNALHQQWNISVVTELAFDDIGRMRCTRRAEETMGEPVREAVIQALIEELCKGAASRHDGQDAKGIPQRNMNGLLSLSQDLGLQHHLHHDLLFALDENPSMTISEAAGTLNQSVRSVQRALHHIGLTYPNLRSACRMLKATRFLHSSGMTLTEIAQEAGFFDSAHFSKAFLRSSGVNPSKYREIAASRNAA